MCFNFSTCKSQEDTKWPLEKGKDKGPKGSGDMKAEEVDTREGKFRWMARRLNKQRMAGKAI